MKQSIVGFILLLLIGTGVYFAIRSFQGESRSSRAFAKEINQQNTDDLIGLYVKVTAVDPIQGNLSVRVEPTPLGNLANEDGSFAKDVTIYIPSASSAGPRKPEFTFYKNKLAPSFETVLSLHEGNTADYPFDDYISDLYIYAEEGLAETKEGEGEKGLPPLVPVEVRFRGSIPGYNIEATTDKLTDFKDVQAEIRVDRSISVVSFSIFVAVVMWGLSLAVLFLILSILFGERKVEMSMCGFMSALMFAFYGLRNGQPNVPPVGVFSDVACFFWAELIVAGSLIVSILMWVFQKQKPADPK